MADTNMIEIVNHPAFKLSQREDPTGHDLMALKMEFSVLEQVAYRTAFSDKSDGSLTEYDKGFRDGQAALGMRLAQFLPLLESCFPEFFCTPG